jgi:hypothetical protein
MLTTFLEILGLLLIVAAAMVGFGLAAGIFVAGVCCLVAAWSIARAGKR